MPNQTPPQFVALRAARHSRGWSQVRLAAELKRIRRRGESVITPGKISQHERGKPAPSFGALCRYARALDLALIVTPDRTAFVDPAAIALPPEGE